MNKMKNGRNTSLETQNYQGAFTSSLGQSTFSVVREMIQFHSRVYLTRRTVWIRSHSTTGFFDTRVSGPLVSPQDRTNPPTRT